MEVRDGQEFVLLFTGGIKVNPYKSCLRFFLVWNQPHYSSGQPAQVDKTICIHWLVHSNIMLGGRDSVVSRIDSMQNTRESNGESTEFR